MNEPAGTPGDLPGRAAAPASGVVCRRIVIEAAPAAPWREARDACDAALAQGHAFVAILHAAEAFAEAQWLADADRRRASRFRRDVDRQNFILGRTLVHHLVCPRAATTPGVCAFGPHGKPYLPGAPAYNLSHSGRCVACAISRDEPVGIDVETFARLKDHRDLLPVIAHPNERRCIEQAPADQQLALFKRCWTRKEAVLKAIGTGLGDDLQIIDTALEQSEPLLDEPMPLRLMDLALARAEATIALALEPAVAGVVVMSIAAA